MINLIRDNVFGELSYSSGDTSVGFWHTSEYLPLLGQMVKINLEVTPGQGPTQRQKQIYLTFIEQQMGLKAELQEALFAYYNGVRPTYLSFFTVEEDESLPVLDRSDQIWELLTPSSVLISQKPTLSERNEDLGISWHTVWDPEMFLHANYRGLTLISVDQD